MMFKNEAGSINRVNYRRYDTFKCTVGSHLPHPITALALLPRHIAGTNLPTPREWIQRVEREFNPGRRAQDPTRYQWTNRAVHYRPRIKSQKTARSAVGVEPTTFRTAVTDDDKVWRLYGNGHRRRRKTVWNHRNGRENTARCPTSHLEVRLGITVEFYGLPMGSSRALSTYISVVEIPWKSPIKRIAANGDGPAISPCVVLALGAPLTVRREVFVSMRLKRWEEKSSPAQRCRTDLSTLRKSRTVLSKRIAFGSFYYLRDKDRRSRVQSFCWFTAIL